MEPDKFQQAWQAHSTETRVTVNDELLRKEVQRNQQDFRALILRRDVIEISVGVLLLIFWFYAGPKNSLPWTWYLGIPAISWIVGFFVVDRIRHPQQPSQPGESLLSCARNSLRQVEHQIWLLRHVFWWYLLPPTISCLAFFGQVCGRSPSRVGAIAGAAVFFGMLAVVYALIDYINQHAVRVQLAPRRQELLALAASLGGDEATEVDVPTVSDKATDIRAVTRRWLLVMAISLTIYTLLMLLLGTGPGDANYEGPAKTTGAAGDSLGTEVTALRTEKKLVGLAAMVTVDGRLEAAAVSGERKIGSGMPIELGDQWHLGGITKSITATMIARLVEAGRLQWSDTVGERFSQAAMHDDWRPVTLQQLLSDTAGAPANFPKQLWNERPAPGAECIQARRDAVLDVVAEPPVYTPGTKHLYSNAGCTIAAAMAEQVTGDAWEDLVRREVFEPLDLKGAGFGPPPSGNDTLEQPRGHRNGSERKFAVDDTVDNSPIMGPSGTVHMTLADLCTFANEHLRGERGEGKLLSAETYQLLHAPVLDRRACGWVQADTGFKGQPVMYWHNGSNTLWYALVVFVPDLKMVVAVAANDGDFAAAEAAAWQLVLSAGTGP